MHGGTSTDQSTSAFRCIPACGRHDRRPSGRIHVVGVRLALSMISTHLAEFLLRCQLQRDSQDLGIPRMNRRLIEKPLQHLGLTIFGGDIQGGFPHGSLGTGAAAQA